MGCGQSDLNPRKDGHRKKKGEKAPPSQALEANPLAGPASKGPTAEDVSMLGRQKYIAEVGAICMEDATGTLLLFAPLDYSGVVLSYRDSRSGLIYAREFTDAQLTKEKEAAGINFGWPPFFKSLASDVLKSKATIAVSPQKVEITVTIVSSKDTKTTQPFSIRLDPKAKTSQTVFNKDQLRYVIEPMTRMIQKRRGKGADKEKELRFAKAECEKIVKEAEFVKYTIQSEKLLQVIRPLRESAASHGKTRADTQNRISQLERKLKRLDQGKDRKHPLDSMYEEGGSRYYQHIPCSDEHFPRDLEPKVELQEIIRAVFPLQVGATIETITRAPTTPQLQRLYEQAPASVASDMLQAFLKLDNWDYSVFDIDRCTNGNALYFTTYAILYKLNLVNYFNIDDRILRNFLSAVQAGYHPNPYHNATHAADVTQVNYFILQAAGLSNVCQLTQEQLLAGVLAGAIHDYDHPGFNNNFHTRTNAYLSTLYNDRSILENHHCACIFEMLRRPEYDIFKGLPDDSKHEIRDTMLEMVLATDMGNHAKIFSSFRRRVTEGAVWHDRIEDVRLALSMSIKMADISNCGRPNFLYVEWAKNIALEFYNQGDVEARFKLPISPFMDRRKDKAEFPKGQTSFMNYIVIPMLEAISEVLPKLEIGVQHCNENRDYWARQGEA